MKRLVQQMVRFAAVGLSAFAIDYVLFLILNLFLPYMVANLISYTIATVYNFVLSMKFVFSGKASQSRVHQFIIFAVLAVVGLILNEINLYYMVHSMGWLEAVSKVVSTFLVTIFNFISRKFFLEDRHKRPIPVVEGVEEPSLLETSKRDVDAILREQIEVVTRKRKFEIF